MNTFAHYNVYKELIEVELYAHVRAVNVAFPDLRCRYPFILYFFMTQDLSICYVAS
jgi:hypothetical protein